MPRPNSLTLAQNQVLAYFRSAPRSVYSEEDLEALLNEKRDEWRLAKRTSSFHLISLLEKQGSIIPHVFHSSDYHRGFRRYAWGPSVSPLTIAQSYKPRAYLCHGTAVALHGLGAPDSKTIYLNTEQSPKPLARGSLTQERLSLAFSRAQRQSKLRFAFDDGPPSLVIVAGKYTDSLGVEKIQGTDPETLRVTNLPRTLIDIVVRPAYAGGVSHVLNAYRSARNRVSVDDLLAILQKLDYVYPYHQAIGFLMQVAGYPEKSYAKLRSEGLQYDFYLAHGMQDPAYSEEWRLFYPESLKPDAYKRPASSASAVRIA